MISRERRTVLYVNLVIVVLEIIAFIHDVYAFKLGLFEGYLKLKIYVKHF